MTFLDAFLLAVGIVEGLEEEEVEEEERLRFRLRLEEVFVAGRLPLHIVQRLFVVSLLHVHCEHFHVDVLLSSPSLSHGEVGRVVAAASSKADNRVRVAGDGGLITSIVAPPLVRIIVVLGLIVVFVIV